MLRKKSEKGQAIILIVFSIIGIIGLTALTIDGGLAYSDRRSAQGAADSAAWAGGLSNARYQHPAGSGLSEADGRKAAIIAAAEAIADQNGYMNDDGDADADPSNATRTDVYVNVSELPENTPATPTLPDGSPNPCPEYASPNVEISVEITSYVKTFFAPVIGVERVTNHVVAITRACGTYKPAIFGGYAIASCGQDLASNQCAFNSGSSANPVWHITGSGLHSDTCIEAKYETSIDLESGQCLDGVSGTTIQDTGGASPDACGTIAEVTCTSTYLDSVMPENPCDGDADDIGVPLPSIPMTHNGDMPYILDGGGGDGTVYCVNTAGQVQDLENADVVLKNATIYINMDDFSLDYAGNNGSLTGTPSESGTYSSLAVVVMQADTPCTGSSGPQSIDYRGNAGSPSVVLDSSFDGLQTDALYGTILAPTSCVTLKGNAGSGAGASTALELNGQVVGNMVTSNGNIDITVNYVEDQNYRPPEDPTIILVQ